MMSLNPPNKHRCAEGCQYCSEETYKYPYQNASPGSSVLPSAPLPCHRVYIPPQVQHRRKDVEYPHRTEQNKIENIHFTSLPHPPQNGGIPPPINPGGSLSLFFLPLPFLPMTPSCFISFCISSN